MFDADGIIRVIRIIRVLRRGGLLILGVGGIIIIVVITAVIIIAFVLRHVDVVKDDADEVAGVQRLFYTRDLSGACWREPRVVFGAVFAFSIAKELIGVHRCPIDVHACAPGFDHFSSAYRPLIMCL